MGLLITKTGNKTQIRISFKKSLDDAASEFSAIQLLYFFLSKQNEGYRGATLQVDQSPVNFDKVTATSHMLSEEQSVFLRVLLAGPATLYYSYDHKDHYFLQKGDSKIEELIYRLKLVTGDAASNKPATISKIESFKFQLINAFSDCQGLNNDIQKLKFTRAAISSIVKKYNECKGSIVETTHVEKNNSSAQWGIIAGTALATYTVSTNHEYLENAKFGNDNSFVGGVFLNIPFDRRRGATSFYCDLTYQRFGLNSLSSISNPAYQTTYTNAFSASFTTLKMGGRLALPWKTVRPLSNSVLTLG